LCVVGEKKKSFKDDKHGAFRGIIDEEWLKIEKCFANIVRNGRKTLLQIVLMLVLGEKAAS
jgi:hypothetical protein